jgi:modulator of FtsH protease
MDDIVQSQSTTAIASPAARVLKNTYTLLSATLLFTAAITWATQGVHIAPVAYLACVIGSFVLLFVTFRLQNSGLGVLALFGFAGLEGFALGPVISAYSHAPGGSSTVATAALLTGAAFIGLSAYVHITRKDFSAWAGMLFAGLLVVVVASLISMFFSSPATNMALAAVSSLLFCGYILFDTSRIIHGGETNYIMATVRLYLDILNLFLSLLRLLGDRR